jgi:hypothetical protein
LERFAVLAAPGCYLNHSCDSNAMRHGVKVFAWRPIAAGHEITIDYRLNAFDDDSWFLQVRFEELPGRRGRQLLRYGRRSAAIAPASRTDVHPARASYEESLSRDLPPNRVAGG